MRPLEVRLAARSAAALYGLGAVLLGLAAAFEDPDSGVAIADLAGLALAIGLFLLWLERRGRASPGVVFAAELGAIGIVAALVALTGEAQSPYPAFYLLGVLHAAVFQPRPRFVVAGALAVAALLAPLVYDSSDAESLAPYAFPALLAAIVLACMVHVAIEHLRREGRTLTVREAEALRIAELDDLTGIGNYRRFWRALQSEAARARRHDQPFSLIVLDLDGFKEINDELGHQAGDEALRRVARALEGELRAEDVLCRQGGDEFAVIAVAAGSGEARELSRRIVDAVTLAAGRGLSHPLSASAGWATFGDPERTAEGLLARADRALLDAKGRRGEPGGAVETAGPAPAASLAPAPDPRRDDGEPVPGDLAPADTAPLAGATERPAPRDPRLAALSACSRALALAEDEQAVVQIAVVHLAQALEAGAIELWRVDAAASEPVLVARGHHAGAQRRPGIPITPARLKSVAGDNHVAALPEGGLLVPVSHGGRVYGVLVIRTQQPGGPGLEERRLALAMANQVGRALAAAAARAAVDQAGPDELERLAATAGVNPDRHRVAELAVATGRELGVSAEVLATLRRAALLHDIGMIGIPAGLPLRPAPLSPDELAVLHEHPIIAERLLLPIPLLSDAARVLRHAHERYDGSGYPDGLAESEIPRTSRILLAAIAYTAMRAARPWRPPLSDDEARTELREAAGAQLDPEVIDALLRVLDARSPAWT
jgi:diguanylate cyclase (GGDEF)-like protein